MDDASATPAGWFPDPEGSRSWRWWNGESWDARTTPYPAPNEHRPAPAAWLTWLAATGPVLGVAASAVVERTYDAARGPLEQMSATGVIHWNASLTTLLVAAVVGFAGEVAVAIWLLRAGQLARSLGYRLSVGPALGAWAWLLPIVKLILPYRLLRDLSPLGHPLRARVRASWMALIAYQVASIAVGLSSATPTLAATLVVAALGLAWWVTFAPVLLATARGLEAAART